MCKVHDESIVCQVSELVKGSEQVKPEGIGMPPKLRTAGGVELQVGKVVGAKIRVVPCLESGEEVAVAADFSHVKLTVQELQTEERHRNPETGLGAPGKVVYKGEDLGKVKELCLGIGPATHALQPQGGLLEIVLPKAEVPVPTKATLSMQYETRKQTASGTRLGWFASEYDAVLDFHQGGGGGCCVIA